MSTDATATDAPAADTVPAPPPAPPAKDGVAADDPEPSPTSAAATVTSGDGEDGFGAEAQPPTAGPAGPWAATDADAGAAPTYATYSSPNPQGNDADDPTKIDLALINALRQDHLRGGVLKLENTLVSFMRQDRISYIEVGGPNNCIVVPGSPEPTSSGGSDDANADANAGDTPPPSQPTNVAIEGAWPAGQPFPNGKQSSFQRLVVHRLADRFNIMREAATTQLPKQPKGGYYPHWIPTLVRLVKTKESRIPELLLIDFDLTKYAKCYPPTPVPDYSSLGGGRGRGGYQPYGGRGGRGGRGGGPTGPYSQQGYPSQSYSRGSSYGSSASGGGDAQLQFQQQQQDMVNGMAAASMNEPHAPQDRGPPKKMMIMKRSSSKLSSSGSLNNGDDKGDGKGSRRKSKGKKSLKGKDIDEKEKVYEEARARIFGKEDEEAEEAASAAEAADANGNATKNQDDSDNKGNKKSKSPVPGQVAKSSSAKNLDVSAPVFTPVGMSPNSPSPKKEKMKPQQQQQQQQQQAFRRPSQEEAGGNDSKVTWRNRKEEESDPDFRRGGAMRVAPMPMGGMPPAGATAMGPGGVPVYYGQQMGYPGGHPGGYYPQQDGQQQQAAAAAAYYAQQQQQYHYYQQQQQHYGGGGYGQHPQGQPPQQHPQPPPPPQQQQPSGSDGAEKEGEEQSAQKVEGGEGGSNAKEEESSAAE